jgi:hypothetical protein
MINVVSIPASRLAVILRRRGELMQVMHDGMAEQFKLLGIVFPIESTLLSIAAMASLEHEALRIDAMGETPCPILKEALDSVDLPFILSESLLD